MTRITNVRSITTAPDGIALVVHADNPLAALTSEQVVAIFTGSASRWSTFGGSDDPITVSYGQPLRVLPIGREHPELLKQRPSHGHDQTIINGISRIGYMSGAEPDRSGARPGPKAGKSELFSVAIRRRAVAATD